MFADEAHKCKLALLLLSLSGVVEEPQSPYLHTMAIPEAITEKHCKL